MAEPTNEDLTKFLPMTRAEMDARGWDELDVLLVSGDACVDHPSFAAALLGRFLEDKGYRVGVAAQPDWRDAASLRTLGAPRLFVGICPGAVDSMLDLYTATRKRRSGDDYSPGGRGGRRPKRAAIVYANLARRAFPGAPVVVGGIEASMRRFAHYDYWDDRVRGSLLIDSGADLLVYGMGESAILAIARRLAQPGQVRRLGLRFIPGTVFLGAESDLPGEERTVRLPSREEIERAPEALIEATRLIIRENSPHSRNYLAQRDGDALVIGVHPPRPLAAADLDALYELPFTRREHWSYDEPVPAAEPIRFSVVLHRGCYGGCTFCSLGAHQGKTIRDRSLDSVRREVARLAAMPEFRGTITDLGGPTANMYGTGCGDDEAGKTCARASCLFPRPCRNLRTDPARLLELLRAVRAMPAVEHAFVASGVRYDLALLQGEFLAELITHHVGGHLSVAPEHAVDAVLELMGKPPLEIFERFRAEFERLRETLGREVYLSPYFISSFPGCTVDDMRRLRDYLRAYHLVTRQVQDFIPLPLTIAGAMYYAGRSPRGEPIHVAKTAAEKREQREFLQPARDRRGKRQG